MAPPTRIMRLAPALASLSLLLAVGCGDDAGPSVSDNEAEIRQTVIAWYAAAAGADGTKMCELSTPAVRKATAEEGPNVVVVAGKLEDVPNTCAARAARAARDTVVAEGIAPSVSNASVTKVDILQRTANVTTRLGQGERVMALEQVRGKWLVSGFPGS